MSFPKKIFLFTSLFIFLFGSIAFFLYKKSSDSGNFTPPKKTEEIVKLNREIETFTLPEAKLIDTDTYLIQEGPKEASSPNPNFAIYYFKDTGEYSIVLLKTPLEKTRKEAEDAFLKQIAVSSVTKEEACLLFVTVGTIASVDEVNSGRNFGLSFCPDGKSFE